MLGTAMKDFVTTMITQPEDADGKREKSTLQKGVDAAAPFLGPYGWIAVAGATVLSGGYTELRQRQAKKKQDESK